MACEIRYVIQIEFAFEPRRAKEKKEAREPESISCSRFWIITTRRVNREARRSMDMEGSMVFALVPVIPVWSRDLPFSGMRPAPNLWKWNAAICDRDRDVVSYVQSIIIIMITIIIIIIITININIIIIGVVMARVQWRARLHGPVAPSRGRANHWTSSRLPCEQSDATRKLVVHPWGWSFPLARD